MGSTRYGYKIEGRLAFLAGEPVTANPLPGGSRYAQFWFEGWLAEEGEQRSPSAPGVVVLSTTRGCAP
jgi:hypothetical protein